MDPQSSNAYERDVLKLFRDLSSSCGLFAAWDETILPGMRDVFVATMLAAQENAEPRTNSFEVYGVDFMLTADCK